MAVRIIKQSKELIIDCKQCELTLGYLESDLSPKQSGYQVKEYGDIEYGLYKTVKCPNCNESIVAWYIEISEEQYKEFNLIIAG